MYQGKRCQIWFSTLWSSIISCCSATCAENSRDSSNQRVMFFSSSKMPQHLWRTSEPRHWRKKTYKGINTETDKLMFMCLLVSSNLIILPINKVYHRLKMFLYQDGEPRDDTYDFNVHSSQQLSLEAFQESWNGQISSASTFSPVFYQEGSQTGLSADHEGEARARCGLLWEPYLRVTKQWAHLNLE